MGIFCLLCATTILGARVWEGNTSGTGDCESSSWLISLGKPNGEKAEQLLYPRARAGLQFHTRCFKAPENMAFAPNGELHDVREVVPGEGTSLCYS